VTGSDDGRAEPQRPRGALFLTGGAGARPCPWGRRTLALTLQKLRPFVPAAAGLMAALGACFVFLAFAGEGVPAAAAACAAVFLAALVVPAISITAMRVGSDGFVPDLYRWACLAGGVSGGSALGILVFTLVAARPVFLAALASVIVIDACAFSFGALARALGKAFRSPVAGGLVAGAVLLGLVAAPFWSRGLLGSAAGAWLAGPLVGASPFLASAVPWTAASASWTFDARVSDVLYRVWVGTDFPVQYPSWISCAVGHVLAGCCLLAASDLPRILRERRAEATDKSGGGTPA